MVERAHLGIWEEGDHLLSEQGLLLLAGGHQLAKLNMFTHVCIRICLCVSKMHLHMYRQRVPVTVRQTAKSCVADASIMQVTLCM